MGAKAILTDSGGMQKEAFFHKVPCITLRDETEWVETVNSGWNTLAGASTEKILKAVEDIITPIDQSPYYGDGCSASKIIQELLK